MCTGNGAAAAHLVDLDAAADAGGADGDDDGAPLWTVPAGAPLVPGHLAWHRLGVGLRCETWLTWSVARWAPVVVKLARPHQVDHPRARQALSREAACLGGCPHPHLPRLYADALTADRPHLVVEYLDGPTLDELVDERGALGPAEVVALAAQLAGVLRWLHGHGVAHLDVKPANVVVRDGEPVLVDLGSARPLGHRSPTPLGSPGHAAPELETGDPATAATDLYGLGTVLHEVLTGAPAFDPDRPADARPDPADLLLPGGALGDLVRTLLAPDPASRPDDADAVLAALHALHRAVAGPDELPIWPPFAVATGLPRAGVRRTGSADPGPRQLPL